MLKEYFKNTFPLSTIMMFVLFLGISCQQQINSKKTVATQSSKRLVVKDISKGETAIINSKEARTNNIDSVIVNQYRDGKKDGLWRNFYESGQLRTEGNYKLGLKEGLHREWQVDGILLLEGFYKKGKAEGWMKWFHERGHLAAEGNMVAGARVGPWKICDVQENGFCIEAYFKDGKRDGVWKIYHEHAPDKLWKEQTWKEDKVVSEKCWDEQGVLVSCES